MKHVRGLICVFIVLSFIAVTQGELAATSRGISIVSPKGKELYLYKDYHALVVGVSNYDKWPDLPNAVKDAKEVSSALQQLGFQVKEVYDPTSRQLKKALNDLTYRQGREKNRAILFYFAGHGETEALADGAKLGYIIPSDCPLIKDDPQGFINHAISMKDIEAYSLRIRSKHLLALFDSCFSGSLFSLGRAVPEDISEKIALPVRQYITAGSEDETVPDRSMFKKCLILGLKGDADLTRDGYITGSELGMYLSDKVVQYTRKAQHPQYGKINNPDLDRGDFVIQLASSGATLEEPATTTGKTTLSVTSNVTGATVFVDNRTMGRTPVADLELTPGGHMIRVEKDGYDTYQKRIRLKEGRSLSITAYLDTIQPQTGSLNVDTDPDNARVRILNIIPKYYRGIEVAPGRYHVEVSASGYETKKEWIDLAEGEDKYIDVRLTKRRASVATLVQDTGKTFTNTIGMTFVQIPPGTFMMGSPLDEQGRDRDETQHRVTLTKGFYLGTTEVTQGQWKRIMGNSPSYFQDCGDDCPVEQVSWSDAYEFIKQLNRKEATDKYRLPTEAEWEYACRAGSVGRFSFGDSDAAASDYAWYYDSSSGTTHRVAQKKPNAWGLYDMHGNVWEWCRDCHSNYQNGHVTDPKVIYRGPPVYRGGGWNSNIGYIRSASRRYLLSSGQRTKFLGFRVARDL